VGTPNGTGHNASVGIGTNTDPQVFDPGTPGETENAGGNPSGDDPGQTVGTGNTTSSAGGSFVPLSRVIAAYETQATAALDRADVAPSVRALVRSYFDLLGNP
jgi:hypothetical protein